MGLICVCLGFYAWQIFEPDYEIKRAAESFEKGDYDRALKTLKELEQKIPGSQYHLYLAYIAREKSTLQESNEQLTLAETSAKEGSGSKFLEEIYLNQAFNNYLTRKPDSMQEPLEKADKISRDKQWVVFFQTLQDYLMQKYQPALDKWQKPLESGYLSVWMKKTFRDTFDDFWYATHLAQADIALGNYLAARQQLERESKKAKESQLDQIYLLLGLSYIKEAEEKPVLLSTPYYKLAFSYLNRVPMQNSRYAPYRTQILSIIQNQINILINDQDLEDLSFYVGILETWQDKQGLQNISNKLLELIEQSIENKKWKNINFILTTLNHHLKPQQKQAIEVKLTSLFDRALQEEQISSLNELWEALHSFSQSPNETVRIISNKIALLITEIIFIDNEDLSLTIPYLEFWMSLEKNPSSRLEFSFLLLGIVENMWIENVQAKKALTLLTVILKIPLLQDQDLFYKYVRSHLLALYTQSKEQGNASLLHAILKAMDELQLKDSNQNKIDSLKALNDSDELLKKKHYYEAKEKINWVLELEPTDQKALRIAGLANYYLANYTVARDFLSKVLHPDATVKEALLISDIITQNSSPSNLVEQALKNHLAGNTVYKRLGLGLIESGNAREGLEWLNKISDPDFEVKVGKIYAYYLLSQWQKVSAEYSQLPENYKKIPLLKRLVIESTAGTGQIDQAERLLKDLLKNKENPAKISLSFQFLNNFFLEGDSPNFTAGIFYKSWKHDNEKALEYLHKIKNPSTNVVIAISEILILQKKYQEAKTLLQTALESPHEDFFNLIQSKRMLGPLAVINQKMGDPFDAAKNFLDYYNTFPGEILYRTDFAHVLMELRRFDAAIEQLNLVLKVTNLSNDEKLNYIDCLIHLGNFSQAEYLALKYLSEEPPMLLSDQLKLAQLLLIVGDNKTIQAVLHRVPEQKLRSIDVSMELIYLWMKQGDYDRASKEIKLNQSTFEKSSEGLMLLATYYANTTNGELAYQLAMQSLTLDPFNQNALVFINDHKIDVSVLKKNLETIKNQIQNEPNNILLKINYAKNMLEIGFKLQSSDDMNAAKDNFEINEATIILAQLTQSIQNLPLLYLLLGKAYFFKSEELKAKLSLENATRLDSSYSNARSYLSKVLQILGKSSESFEQLQKALVYEPYNSELWVDKGNLFEQNNDMLEALECLEKAVKFMPSNVKAYIKLGEIDLNSEDPEGAKIALEKALKLSPNNAQALKLLLITLYHPLLANAYKDKNSLEKDQKSIYNQLHQIEPTFAQELIDKIHQEENQ
jgi:tetratricopeptide (TPR) repeat protein